MGTFRRFCNKLIIFVLCSRIWLTFCVILLILTLAIIQFRDECYHVPIPPSEKRLKRCEKEVLYVNGGHDFVRSSKSLKRVESPKKTALVSSDNNDEGVSEKVLEIRKSVFEYYSDNLKSTKKACITMFDEGENEEWMASSATTDFSERSNESEEKYKRKNQIQKENKFFMKTSPDRRTRWIFYKHKDTENELELHWCPLFKSASSPWMAIFTKLSGALTPKTEMKIRSGKATFMTLAKDFRLFVPEAGRQNSSPKYNMVIVRHPFTRILSAYRDKLERVNGREFYRKKFSKTIIQRFRRAKQFESKTRSTDFTKPKNPLWLSLALELQQSNGQNNYPSKDPSGIDRDFNSKKAHETPTFEEFCQYLLTVDPRKMDEHWRPQYLDCSPCHHKFNLILKVEEMEKDKMQVLKLLGYENNMTTEYQELESAWERWSNRSPNKGNQNDFSYFSQLSKSLIIKLYNVYEPDFKLFGYYPDEYFEMAKSG